MTSESSWLRSCKYVAECSVATVAAIGVTTMGLAVGLGAVGASTVATSHTVGLGAVATSGAAVATV